MHVVRKLTRCLWLDDQAGQSAGLDTGIFGDSKTVAERER
jgi:hypothetical protein